MDEYIFPLRARPPDDYHTGGRNFGASRSGGARKHAGCDLIAAPGTEILCMTRPHTIWAPEMSEPNTVSTGEHPAVIMART